MELDPRGQRFAAVLTSFVIIVILATGWGWLAVAQAVVFAITAADPRRGPWSTLFRALVLPRIGPPAEREPVPPVRFAQMVGFSFMTVSAVGYLAGLPLLGVIAAGFALLAAFLNAAFGLCLGCEAYLAMRRLNVRRA
jgi:Domain of unknown function (DUF4395)